jgi:hypothetical protein
MVSVTPRCKLKKTDPYISAQGTYFPCCWIANEPYVTQLKKWLGNDYSQLDTKTHELSDIVKSKALERLEHSWRNGTFRSCVRFCGQPYDPDEPIARDQHLTIDFASRYIDEW